ncbi:thioredoxin family protein [Companilactobacillus furfuricola]|uniref:thioredoxin family protein n=1 Tax=Companilactobacillus furfuricola TaxID=1462575 RepID=UPI000F78D4B1|nr:thioredoxin family protein [Companilactobacillus furfuricola]
MLEQLTSENYAVRNQTGVSVISFNNDWCAQCYTQQPILEKAAEKFAAAKFYQMNADRNTDIISQYDVYSAPSLVVEKDGTAVYAVAGFLDADQLDNILKYYL